MGTKGEAEATQGAADIGGVLLFFWPRPAAKQAGALPSEALLQAAAVTVRLRGPVARIEPDGPRPEYNSSGSSPAAT